MPTGDGFWSYASEVPGDSPRPVSPELAPGDVVAGRYQVSERLGRGGHAVVYRARVLDAAAREVALKVLESVSPQASERLMREARVLARIRHPAVLRIHDAVEDQGKPVLVLELVDGADWEAQLAALDREVNLNVLERVAEGLGEAHALGLVHRDVKPANVLLAADGPRLSDFGLVRGLAVESLTQTGALLGTPRYMAPEQLRGESDVGPAADVWALGVILYEVLAGQLPFEGEGLLEQCAIVQEGAEHLAPVAGGAIDTVWRRALDPEPQRRYSTATEFAGALAAARLGVGAPAAPRRARVSGWGLLALVGAVGGGAAAAYQAAPGGSSEPAGSPTVAAIPASSTVQEPSPAPPAARFVWRRELEAAWVRGDHAAALERADRCVEEYGEFEDYVMRAWVEQALGDLDGARRDALSALDRRAGAASDKLLFLSRVLFSLEEFEGALVIADTMIQAEELLIAGHYLRARSLEQLGRPGGEADLSRVLELGPNPELASLCRFMRGQIRLEQGRAREALLDFEQVTPDEGYRQELARLTAEARRLLER